MPDDYDYSQKPQRRGTKAAAPAPPLTTFLLMGISLVATLPRLMPNLLNEPIWQKVFMGFNGQRDDVWSGQYYYLLTNIFSHGDILHLVFNMMWLFTLGTILEMTIGPLMMMLFVVVSAVISSTAEMAVAGNLGIGFSGVIYAMFGMMWAARGRFPAWASVANADNFRYMFGWAVLCLFTTYFGLMRVANTAHFSGLLFGVCIGMAFLAPRRKLLWTIPLALLLVIAILSVTVMPNNAAWLTWHEPFGALFHVFAKV